MGAGGGVRERQGRVECVSSRAIIMALSFLENETKLGSHAAKLIGDDSISDVENTVLALKINQGTKYVTLYEAHFHI